MGNAQWAMAVAIASLGIAMAPARGASLFGSQDLNPQTVAAIAVPLQDGNRYNLLILEQLQDQQPCWRERGTQPTVVDPLLMNFDFTGLCNRSTDSNGYSLRLGDQDQEWRYQFVLRRTASEVKLFALPVGNNSTPAYEVGSTQGLTEGYLKIHLHPGWRLSQRVYQGKVLPHFYIASDRTPPPATSTAIAVRPPVFTPPADPVNNAPSSEAIAPSQWVKLPPAPLNDGKEANPPLLWKPPAVNTAGGDLPPPPPVQSVNGNTSVAEDGGWVEFASPGSPVLRNPAASVNYRVVIPDDGEAIQRVKALVPDAFRIWNQGRPMIQAGAFQQIAEAESLQEQLRSQGLLAQVMQVP